MYNKEFKYKLDFYYQQALLYLLTLILYVGVKGTISDKEFILTLNDPIVLIIVVFVCGSFLTLFLSILRAKKIIITEHSIIFQNSKSSKEILFSEIEWAHVGKETMVRTAGTNQIVLLKVKNRLRVYRIRIGRYEKSNELLISLKEIVQHLPKKQKRSLSEVRSKFLKRKK